ncbi:MAG: cob(I)yrinic acid a,c-diamide adenosyltransferase [Candidatus Lokiarchaeota archaeon]|nr:cob(I)yrinic acid a,c-diamide adenosyltransferase [Candidatus Lokiarchaeota archaeon]
MPGTLYTRKGDKGETGLLSGERIEKTDPRVEAYGTIDEFNSTLGVAKAFSSPRLAKIIEELQVKNFFIASELATTDRQKAVKNIAAEDVSRLESLIDGLAAELPPAEHFVVPGGTKSAAFLHVSRTVLRRAERHIVRLAKEQPVNPELIRYVNRLSDLVFELARYANIADGDGDTCISRDGTFLQKRAA